MSTPPFASRKSALTSKIGALGTKILGLKKDFTELKTKTRTITVEADEHTNEVEVQKLRAKIQSN